MAENLPIQIQTFAAGAAYDGDLELMFSKEGASFVDGHNVEPTSNDGNTGAVQKIKGEVKVYGGAPDNSYKCVGSWQVRNFLVEFWGPTNPSFPGICKVNGVIVLESTDFTISALRDLDGDKSEADEYCEVYITDYPVQPPYIFDINDMVNSLSSDPNKYFANFDPKAHQINIQSALDHPVFVGLETVGGGGGKPAGKYQYQMRYASSSGDRTQWSHPTPLIPVAQSTSSASREYPYTRTFGGPPDPQSKTAYAPKLRFRVTNLYDYEFIEIKCIEYNGGAGINFSANGKIVAKIAISPGEISIKEYIDPAGSNVDIALSAEDETRELAYIESCKSIRYFDRRLVPMNITVPSKDADVTFRQENGKEGWPVLESMGKAGHKDPWYDTYRRSEMRGERVGYGVAFYDTVGNKAFVKQPEQLKDYALPNRRDRTSTETFNYSFGKCVVAACTEVNSVQTTHEVFDLAESVAKTNKCDFKNVIQKGRIIGGTGTKSKSSVKEHCSESDPQIENHDADVGTLGVSTDYLPFHPVSKNDPDVSGHNYIVNTRVSTQDPPFGSKKPSPEDQWQYSPPGFAPKYYSMGMMLAGIENIPDWAKSFSVVRTDPAQRVVCQGLAYYSLTKGAFKAIGNETLGGKESDAFWFYSPDIDNGMIASEVVNDIAANPQNYKVQFVSPLGFFSEYYSAEDNLLAGKRDRCIDMISYVRMIRDVESGDSVKMNPGESQFMGISAGTGDGYRYVDFEKYRNIGQRPTTFDGSADKGNRLFDISAMDRNVEGRGSFFNLRLGQQVYGKNSVGGNSDANFGDDGLKNWTEPIYVVNIIRTGAKVSDRDIQKFRQTSHYQKVESIIGKSNGEADQVFPLVDERWEDCIPSPNAGEFGSTIDRYVYVKKTDGTVDRWINVTYKSPSQRAGIQANILAGIGTDKGTYTHTNVGGTGRFFELNFNSGFTPQEGSLILVRYDSTAPIRFYGGDTYISEALFSPIDGRASASDNEAESQFCMGIGLPYKNFQINPRYYTIRKAGASVNAIQDTEWFTLGFIRQLCVMFACETRSGLHLNYGLSRQTETFPLTHYIIRPNRWDLNKTIIENHFFDDYQHDYTDAEKDLWKWGGFRFTQSVNPDYAVMPPHAFFSKPQFGFTEKRKYPNMIMWGLQRSVNVRNAPGLRTFPANNSYMIEDETGEITFGYDANSERGDNLYAITEKGVALMVTKKTVLSDLDAGQIGYMASGQFITNRLWISKSVGVPSHMRGSVAEANVPITLEDGTEVRKDGLFFSNGDSAFRMIDNNIIDIGRANYHSKLYKDGLSLLVPGTTRVSSIFDNYKQQYYLALFGETIENTFVFSQKRGAWFGTNDFRFEKFTTNGNKTYGHREMQTYELNRGYTINGDPITFRLLAAFAPESPYEKEFVRVRVNSAAKPNSVGFYKEKAGVEQCLLDTASLGPRYLKNYGGWSQFIPRIKAAVSANRPRLQNRVLIVEVIHGEASEYVLKDIGVQYKPLVIQ